MANTSSRMLRLLSLLQAQRYWPGPQLAERLGVSLRTLRRDVERLRDLGYPVDASRGVDGGYQLAPGAALPPLVVDDEEAVALALGLLTGSHSPVTGIAEASVRALSKLIPVMPKALRYRVETLSTMTESATWSPPPSMVDPETLIAVAQACRDTERLHFDYVAADQTPTQRRVEPHRLVWLGRHWYVVAYDVDRGDWRSFRVDRLSAPRRTGSRFEPRQLPAPDAAAFVRAGIAPAPRPLRVDAVVSAPASDVRTRVGRWAEIEEHDEQSCRLHFSIDSPDWAMTALVMVDAEFVIEQPPELLEHVRTWAERFSKAVRQAEPV